MVNDLNREREIRARQSAAGRFGFVLGCIAALVALGINLYRAPRPLTITSALLAALMAALNMPLGIVFGLVGERISRPDDLRRR